MVRGSRTQAVREATNYRVAVIVDVTAAAAFLVGGYRSFDGSWMVAATVVVIGGVSFSLLEYATHRWLLHGPPSAAARRHAEHHARPAALIAVPFFVVTAVALGMWALVAAMTSGGMAALLIGGVYGGYNYFAFFHHWEHHHRGNHSYGAYWRALDQAHHLHHRQPGFNFGVSTTIWDRVFSTRSSG